MDKLAIVIPAYNEERRIRRTLKKYSEFFNSLLRQKKLDYEILVVINNTKDSTEEIVKQCIKKDPKISCLNFIKGGKGFAVTEGFKYLVNRNFDYIGFVDADMSTSPEAYYDLYLSIGKNDGAIASRYIRGAMVNPKPKFRRILVSRVFNAFIRAILLFPYRDTQCGAKIFKRQVLASILPILSFSKWAFDIDLIYSARKKGFFIIEVPSVWADKKYSTINFMKAGPWMALGVLRLRLINSPFRFLIRVYDKVLTRIWRLKI